jgi:hypothetical protein
MCDSKYGVIPWIGKQMYGFSAGIYFVYFIQNNQPNWQHFWDRSCWDQSVQNLFITVGKTNNQLPHLADDLTECFRSSQHLVLDHIQ